VEGPGPPRNKVGSLDPCGPPGSVIYEPT